jgi:hypothetical protein
MWTARTSELVEKAILVARSGAGLANWLDLLEMEYSPHFASRVSGI